ncbi:hypothetical protein [Aeromonas veronii]|uniref:hypothetical protein n=1 Tax=Aeromonas veronii TaxID=654 RepID=UPI001C75E88A|nr:hypothetical protein [Aeromonas veronii]QWL75088.1 hypothetical protein HQ396_15265 [Aeromonas hydrophila]UYB71222.1 hypothetical protein NBH81_01550 [Aeromonas veronii]
MKQQAHLITLQRQAGLLARNLTALQLLCHSTTYAHRLDVLVAELHTIASRIDALEAISATTQLNDPLEQTNRYSTALLVLLESCPNTMTPAELASMLSPVIRLLTAAEHLSAEVIA